MDSAPACGSGRLWRVMSSMENGIERAEADALRAFHRIDDDRNGNDTADFLFMPVDEASATDLNHRGSRWSLLLVDRRDRNNPVAHHYDSARRQ